MTKQIVLHSVEKDGMIINLTFSNEKGDIEKYRKKGFHLESHVIAYEHKETLMNVTDFRRFR